MSETTAVLPEPQPSAGRRGTTRGLVAVGASALAVVLIAVGGFAAWQFFSEGGPQPAEVLPDSTFALVTVDLDPSGGQKIEAVQTLRKFPSLRKHLGVTAENNPMKVIVEEALKESPCKSLDYEADVEPWIGSRAGLGGVLLEEDKPAPVLVLQVKDAEKARAGFADLAKCTEVDDDDDFGWTISDDYIVVSDSTSHAKAIAAAGKKSSLSSDADFQKWTDEAGGPGIMNAYFGRNGVKVLADEYGRQSGGLPGDGSAWSATGPDGQTSSGSNEFSYELSDQEPGNDTGNDAGDEITKAMKDFKGAAAGLRFADEGIELSFAGGGVKQAGDGKVGDHVGALPGDTAVVLALAVPGDALEGLGGDASRSPFSLQEMLGEATGLDIPQDLIDFLGTSLSLSLGGDAPADLDNVAGLSDLPIGALIHGDDAKIKRVIEKVEKRTGSQLSDVPATVSSEEGKVAISTMPDYGDQLLDDGSLADEQTFADVVENADDAQAVLYVSFENGWMDVVQEMLTEQGDVEGKKVADNLAVLQAFGASAWSEGDTGHAQVRLALK